MFLNFGEPEQFGPKELRELFHKGQPWPDSPKFQLYSDKAHQQKNRNEFPRHAPYIVPTKKGSSAKPP